jgi:hypothetical protein
MCDIMWVLHFYSIQYSINLISTCIKKLWDHVYVRVEMRYPTHHYPILVFYQGVFFASPWCWQPLACKGTIPTVVPSPSATTSSRGLRQCCLRLVWADCSRGGSNSIELSIVHFCLFYFSAALPSHPFCPACNDCQQGPLPSHFPSPPSPLW